MPNRQSTPGPSTLTAPTVLQPLNSKKRAVSELPPEDGTHQSTKKPKKERELLDEDKTAQNLDKENKKKRKKKKRKLPLTAPDTEHECSLRSQTKSQDPQLTPEAPLPQVETLEPAKIGDSGVHGQPLVMEKDEEQDLSSSDKGKARAVLENPDLLFPQPNESASTSVLSQETDAMREAQAKIAELSAQLEVQKSLLSRHANNLSSLQQSLTCEICLDLLYKPFALSSCGHVVCYMCLIRWFTSIQNNANGDANPNPNPISQPEDVPRLLASPPAIRGIYRRKRKTCPLCRAAVVERPAEIWSIKSMVANLVKSKLVDLPSQPPPTVVTQNNNGERANRRANEDPWHNIFRKAHHDAPHVHQPPPPDGNEGGDGLEDMGMWDAEDQVHRCLDCMYEIWGGLCPNCHRDYPGHARLNDGNDDGDSERGGDGELREHFLRRRLRQIWDGYANPDMGWHGDEDDEEEDEAVPMDLVWEPYAAGVTLTDESMDEDDENLSESESDGNTSSESESGDSLGGSWDSSDEDDDNGDGDLLAHYRDVLHMQANVPDWPFRRHLNRRETDGVARIEEIEDGDVEGETRNSGSETHSQDEDQYERDSFINDDDDDGEEGVRDDGSRLERQLRSHGPRGDAEFLELFDSDDPTSTSDHDDNDYQAAARRLGRGLRLGRDGDQAGAGRATAIVLSGDEDDHEDRPVAVRRSTRSLPRTRSRHRRTRYLVEETSGED